MLMNHVPEYNANAVWSCTGRVLAEQCELDAVQVACDSDHVGNPREGCHLTVTMNGSSPAEQTLGFFVALLLVLVLMCLCGTKFFLVGGGGGRGGSHMSTAIG